MYIPLVQRELIAFILNPSIEHKTTLNPANNIETFERAFLPATSWNTANRRKKNDNGFITVTHTAVMLKSPAPSAQTRSRENCYYAKASALSQAFI